MGEHEHEEEDSHIRISTKSAIALLVAILGVGGANFYSNHETMTAEAGERIEHQLEAIQDMGHEFSPDVQQDTQASTHRIRGLFIEFAAKEEGVRKQHNIMERQMNTMSGILQEEKGSDNRFHRSMDKLESMMREILRNQRRHHPESTPTHPRGTRNELLPFQDPLDRGITVDIDDIQ
jgi:hypothetical protein